MKKKNYNRLDYLLRIAIKTGKEAGGYIQLKIADAFLKKILQNAETYDR